MRIPLALLLIACSTLVAAKKKKDPQPSPLDLYLRQAAQRKPDSPNTSAGSLWSPGSLYADLGTDLRARHIDDMVTILVAERASAVSSGTTKTSRQSSVKASVDALAGAKAATSRLANLAKTSNDTQLAGQGTTSRETVLTTTLTARVTQVLPNGFLVIQADKDVEVNSERQIVTVRGVIRPADINPANQVSSNDIAQLELRINGKGVVGDAIRRPFFLYRLLLGILPF